MKAAVLKEIGATPVYEDFETPVATNDNEVLVTVKAAALKNIDKLLTTGKHYASYKNVPVVVGLDGVGVLKDGTRVYAGGLTGSFAQKMKVTAGGGTSLPDGLDDALAAAIPNAAIGSYLPLLKKGKMQKGDTVLLNGGTGVTGKLGIQLARIYGAARIIVMGHIAGREDDLKALGATHLISTNQPDEAILNDLGSLLEDANIDIVLDYLWGHSLELILKKLEGVNGHFPAKETKIISIGALSGDGITVSSNGLRSGKTVIIGAGLGSYSQDVFANFYKNELPEIFRLAAEGQLKIDIQKMGLKDVAAAWQARVKDKRIVIVMDE